MDVCAYYDRQVNGAGSSTLALLAHFWAKAAPPSIAPADVRGDPVTVLMESSTPQIPLPALNAERLSPVQHIAVHGSQATRDACEFSDIDVIVVLDDSRAFSAREHAAAAAELRRLLRAVYRHDPLMHHGLMFYAASRLHAWDQSLLPLQTLRLASPLYGPRHFELYTVKPDLSALRGRLRRVAHVLGARVQERDFERGDFAYKQFLSNVLLLPSLVAAARGEFPYKRDAFALVKPWFGARAWSGIARAEELRRRWRRPAEPAVQRVLGEFAHPSVRVRFAAGRQRAGNLARFSLDERRQWLDELQRTLLRVEELAS